ncbi:iron ABC transporter permease [Paenibacillus sp. FSL H7-0331]|jgi:iron complex transport system permease protein|uniref:FecCD family ABC transporter permease n=1 Tax=Paenibacillus sp. FSL H7-0331 TaxID=1920421 RepID=UPI00096F79AD|nr:iron ABC transporter permease [Paenibacillus sp. FSL H7-0331]OMF13650.1 iron ABC transporter permease [Paenibacillus sp. FSL H7-0331]
MNRYKTIRFSRLRISILFEKKAGWTLLGLLLLLVVLALVSIGVGTLYISPMRTLQVLFDDNVSKSMEANVIWNFRIPRLLLACLAGMALALSGTILQGVIRNPLASPDIIGVTSGAAMMAVLYLALFNQSLSIAWMPVFAFAGAAGVAGFIYFAAWKKGVSPLRMILVGMGVSALLEAFKTLFIIFSTIIVASKAHIWIIGTIYGASWKEIHQFTPWLLVCIPILILLVRRLNIQVLGDELPVTLGARIQLQRLGLIATAAALAGSAVAFVGGIGFVGLMAPHISRRLVGGSHGALLLCSAIVGAIILVTADLIGRMVLPPRDIPAGVFTAVLGAPVFLYLLIKAKKN